MFGMEDKRVRALRAETAELKATVTAIHRSQAVIEFQLDGTIIDANDNFLATMGYRIEDIRGRHHSLFVDPADAASPEYAHFWERLRAGEFFSDAFRRIGKGGAEIWIRASYNPVFDADGKPYKVIKFASDITAVRREQEASRAEREQAAAVQNQVVSILAERLGRLADGDLTAEIDVFPDQYDRIKGDFNRSVESLRGALSAIAEATGNLQSGSSEIASAADDLSRRTEQQAASLEQTAAAIEEIVATVKRSAGGALEASTAAAEARNHADRSGEVVREAVAAMGEIENSSGQITRIIGVIDEIAFQTNLLALNAGVEAARAGEAGRGFAVVAQEVRALAQRSADAAKEIKVLIASSTAQVARGVRLVGDTGEALSGIVSKVSEIDQLIREIAASSQEQSTGLSQVNAAMNQMDQVTQQNAAMVEETTAAVANMSTEARALARLVGRFRTEPTAAYHVRAAA
ncbi:PAS domain-containing methyl-accepting chemotaxis protein [Caulobacter segnis]|uniref:Chemotaxis protein n=1 Tax=Caulobacter segnis TaxID=88688 RepID=A0A2W5V3U5_9CAUL|nr:PAS domain-containing methyl-accepting chemotaxis protein [Caulobacter segnis]PZR33447.1 MAG: chemotaxis protein [Caulobacter segnis]